MTERHVATQDIGCDHPRKIDWILRASELGRIAQLCFFEIVDRCTHLDRHGECTDPLVHAIQAERLCSEESSV